MFIQSSKELFVQLRLSEQAPPQERSITLKTTGCGLPAGPFGLLGAAEGISYLVVIGFVGAALLNKLNTGSGLPAGPGGLLGAAEGLSFLTAAAGLAVLGFQLADYGYLPEAVPIEGGVCSNIG